MPVISAHVEKASSATPRLVVEDSEQRKRIISIIHDKNHLGVNGPNEMVAQKYYLPGVYKDVTSYVRSQSSTNMQPHANVFCFKTYVFVLYHMHHNTAIIVFTNRWRSATNASAITNNSRKHMVPRTQFQCSPNFGAREEWTLLVHYLKHLGAINTLSHSRTTSQSGQRLPLSPVNQLLELQNSCTWWAILDFLKYTHLQSTILHMIYLFLPL